MLPVACLVIIINIYSSIPQFLNHISQMNIRVIFMLLKIASSCIQGNDPIIKQNTKINDEKAAEMNDYLKTKKRCVQKPSTKIFVV